MQTMGSDAKRCHMRQKGFEDLQISIATGARKIHVDMLR